MLLLNPQLLDQLGEQLRACHANDGQGDFLDRIGMLSADDRVLVEMALKHNLTRRQMAGLLRSTPGSVTRRLHRVINRLHDPFVIALSDPTCTLPPEHRGLAVEYFVQKIPEVQLMRRHGMSRHEVAKMLEYIRGWYRGVSARK